eukprot:scaffold6082_cov51-Phaeocystis_antarctica.AAC.2
MVDAKGCMPVGKRGGPPRWPHTAQPATSGGAGAPPRPLLGIHAARALGPVGPSGWACGAVGGRVGCCEPRAF